MKTDLIEYNSDNEDSKYLLDSIKTEGYILTQSTYAMKESNLKREVSTEGESGDAGTKINLAILDGKYYKVLKSNATNIEALCQICLPKQKTIKGAKNTTSNFRKHLQRVHRNAFTEYMTKHKKTRQVRKRRSEDEEIFAIAKKRKPYFTQEEFDEKILQFIINTMSPLYIIEDNSLIDLFQGLDVNVMGKKAVTNRLNDMYAAHINKIIKDIKKQKHICLTSDVWSAKRRSFIGVTAHWLDENYQRISVALSCQRFAGKHNYEDIARTLNAIANQFSFDKKKIVSTTTDNGTIFEVLSINDCRDIAENVNNSEEEIHFISMEIISDETESDSILSKRKRCPSYTLNLIATNDIKRAFSSNPSIRNKHTHAINKCKKLWKKADHPKSAKIIASALDQTLSVPIITKWNSYYDSIRQIIIEKDKLSDLFFKLKLDSFSETELHYLEEYCAVMKPLAQIFDVLCNEKNIYYGIFLPSIVSLKNKWEKMTLRGFKQAGEFLRKTCLDALTTRFSDTLHLRNDDDILAAVSYPRFKLRWYNVIQNDEITEDVIKKKLRLACQEFVDSDKYADNDMTETRSDDDYFDFNEPQSRPATRTSVCMSKIDLEVLQYLDDKRTDLNMLDNYQHIKEVFIKYNTTLPSSAPVEKLFSFTSIVNAPRRSALSDENFQKLVLLKANKVGQT